MKTGEARTVPLHADLIEQGFLGSVKAKGSRPLFYRLDTDGAKVDLLKPKASKPVVLRTELAKWSARLA